MKILTLLPKEGLLIVNGAAPSWSVSSLALHDAHFIALLSQATAAMAVQPYPGQIKVATNRALIKTVCVPHLNGSHHRSKNAYHTIVIEINSATDNLPIDSAKRNLWWKLSRNFTHYRGGNDSYSGFAAYWIAYSQMVELGSRSMNRGLAPDFAANEPSLDYGQKALDMACASYLAGASLFYHTVSNIHRLLSQSSLFIANTVSNHVQPAEMHNQSINGLALVSAQYTLTAEHRTIATRESFALVTREFQG
ncbi:L-Aspartase-like protein [Mycena floridula]|nr:L-Aspartase-like protein [Mycena floridula]